jgi:hypothetical protein
MQRRQSYGREKVVPSHVTGGVNGAQSNTDGQTSLFSFNHQAVPPSHIQHSTFDHSQFGSQAGGTNQYHDSHFVSIHLGNEMDLDDSTDEDVPMNSGASSQYMSGHFEGSSQATRIAPLKDTILVRS